MSKSLKILGINGSPRKANTDILLEKALNAAAIMNDIGTEIINLRNHEIQYCIGCFKCNEVNDNPSGCAVHNDSMNSIIKKLIECDGIIIASPVYFGSVTAQMKTFMDRTESVLRYTPEPRKAALRNKVGAAIAVGGNRNGGQEATIQGIHHFFSIHDMITVGTGPDNQPGCYLGAAAFSGSDPDKGSSVRQAVLQDELGLRSAEIVGRRIAEMVKMLNPGFRENK